MGRSRGLFAQPIASGGSSSGKNAGAAAAGSWFSTVIGSAPTSTRWHVEVALDVSHGRAPSEWDEATASRFHIDIYSEEWGYYFCHGGRSSWIRVTDVPFVHGRDDFSLLGATPTLGALGALLRQLERTHNIRFQRDQASIRTNLPTLEPAVRAWIAKM